MIRGLVLAAVLITSSLLLGCEVETQEGCTSICTQVFAECDAECVEDQGCLLVCEGERDVCLKSCDHQDEE